MDGTNQHTPQSPPCEPIPMGITDFFFFFLENFVATTKGIANFVCDIPT